MRRLAPALALATGLASLSCGQSDTGDGTCTPDPGLAGLLARCPPDPHSAPAAASRAREAMGMDDMFPGDMPPGDMAGTMPDLIGFNFDTMSFPDGPPGGPDGPPGFPDMPLPDGFMPDVLAGPTADSQGGDIRLPGDFRIQMDLNFDGLTMSDLVPGPPPRADGMLPPDFVGGATNKVDMSGGGGMMPDAMAKASEQDMSMGGMKPDAMAGADDMAHAPVIHDLSLRPSADLATSDGDVGSDDAAMMSGDDDAAVTVDDMSMSMPGGPVTSDGCLHAYDVLVATSVRALRDPRSATVSALAPGDLVWAAEERDGSGQRWLRAVQRSSAPVCGYLDPAAVSPSIHVTPALRCPPGSCPQ